MDSATIGSTAAAMISLADVHFTLADVERVYRDSTEQPDAALPAWVASAVLEERADIAEHMMQAGFTVIEGLVERAIDSHVGDL